MFAVKLSTASIWARKSASARFIATTSGLLRYLSSAESWYAARTTGAGAPPRSRYSGLTSWPPVAFTSGRSGATNGTAVTSNGAATVVIDRIGSAWLSAAVSSAMIPPRHQPTRCTGCPPLCASTVRIAVGMTSSIQCSRPRCRSAKEISP